MKFIIQPVALVFAVSLFPSIVPGPFAVDAHAEDRPEESKVVLNPYATVDWESVEHHKAALHVHTLQSDGLHMVREVVHTYRDAGFTILALTDHDQVGPNFRVPEGEKGSYYPKGPRPENYPANTTWPWTDYGTEAPEELGMVGIQGAELSFRHHINSLFTPYGTQGDYVIARRMRTHGEDDQLLHVKATDGLAFINHPGIDAGWWERKPLKWYVDLFGEHSSDYLIGMEVTNGNPSWEKYDEGLWDQLLVRFMPERPIWGFGTDDMHRMEDYHQSHTVFLLDGLSKEGVREAMETGRFYFTKSSRRADLRQTEKLDEFPAIERIDVDEAAGTITIHGSGYDTIKWISAPQSTEAREDYETSNQPWPTGRVVHEGEILDYRDTPGIEHFVRAELFRGDGEHVHRTFTNPMGMSRK